MIYKYNCEFNMDFLYNFVFVTNLLANLTYLFPFDCSFN